MGFFVGANRAVFLGAVPVMLILGLTAYALFIFATGERAEQSWVVHTYQVMDSLRAVLTDAADAETGQRGYLLTHKDSYLKPFRDSQARLNRDLDQFQYLTRDNPVQQARARTLRKLLAQRLAVLRAVMAAGARAPVVPPDMMALLDQGRAMMDETRLSIALGLAEERRLLDVRVAARRAVEQNEILSAILITVIALIVLLSAAALLVRNNVRLARSEAIRAHQAGILQATLDNIRDGVVVFDD